MRQLGYSVADIARYHGVSAKTVRNWLGRYDEAGSGGMKDRPKSGRPSAIAMKQIRKTATRLFKDGELTTASLQEELHREGGVRFHESYIRKLLHKMGFTSKLPDTVHARAASDEECDLWYGKTMRKIAHYRRRGFAIGIEDEAIISMIAKGRRRMWGPRGEKLRLATAGSRQKKVAYLMVFEDSKRIFRFKEKFDSDSFIEFASEVVRKRKKVFMIVDGAKQHFSNKVEEFLLKQNGNLIIWPLPPASPHMSCVEKGWSIGRGATEAIRSYMSFEEKIADVSKFFRTNRLDLDLFGYLGRRLGPGIYI